MFACQLGQYVDKMTFCHLITKQKLNFELREAKLTLYVERRPHQAREGQRDHCWTFSARHSNIFRQLARFQGVNTRYQYTEVGGKIWASHSRG